MKGFKKIILGVVALFGVLVLTSAVVSDTFSLGKNIEILVNMFRNINLFYVDEVDSDKLLSDAAAGMTSNLDPYTTYLSPEDMINFTILTTGKYGGVGSVIREVDDWVVFAQPYQNSPADKAGIKAGDKIIEIEGKSAKGFTKEQVGDILKGEAGSHVVFKVEKFHTNEIVPLKIKREMITISGVPYYGFVADSVGYIRHFDFTDNCSNDVRKAFLELKKAGAKSVILDYRGNGGGILQESVKILSMFVPRGTEVVSTKSRGKNSASFVTEHDPIDLETPIVVLIDSGSASAAEIVAGALQDLDRAVLVGQRTFGKGLVQSPQHLGNNAYLKLTTAKYYLPSGRCIQTIDYAKRNPDGSIESVPDSLVVEFSTLGGRKVYDGGGVTPDVKIEPEHVSSFAYVVYGLGYIEKFLDQFCDQHYDTLVVDPVEYNFSDQDYAEFIEFMSDKEVKWDSPASVLWRQFKEAAAKERQKGDIDLHIAEIESNLESDTKTNLILYKQELKDIIEGRIVLRYCYQWGLTQHAVATDPEIAQAVEVLKDIEEYNKILTAQDTQNTIEE